MSGRAAAARLLISSATGARLARRVRSGEDIVPAKCGRRAGGGKLGPARATLLAMVTADRDITMVELSRALEDATGVRADEASIGRALRRWGWRFKSRWPPPRPGARTSAEPGWTGCGGGCRGCAPSRTGRSSSTRRA